MEAPADLSEKDNCPKCGSRNTLEKEDENHLHCWSCGTTFYKKDKNTDVVALGNLGGAKDGKTRAEKLTPESGEIQKMDYLLERHQFYENNKAAILADVKELGEKATAKKWKVNGASLFHVLRRWERETKNQPEQQSESKERAKTYKRHRQGVNIHERSKYYEDNKEAIIADLLSNGRKVTRQKWGITSSSLFNLEKKWLTPEQKAAIPEQSNRHRKHASSDRPVFSLISILDQSMIGLLQKLPKHGAPWGKRERESWKRAFDALFEFLYPVTS
jgi:ribosomal protein S27AE